MTFVATDFRARSSRVWVHMAFVTLGALPAHAFASDPFDAPPPPLPPPAPAVAAAPVAPVVVAQPPAAAPIDGQWVYTEQYGWVWMPYAQAYTYVPADGDPMMYVYGSTL